MPVFNIDSNYPIVRIERQENWSQLIEVCEGHLRRPEMNRLRDFLGSRCKTVIVEKDYVCKDYRDTYTNYYSKKFARYPDKCFRLLFFQTPIDENEWWDVPAYAEDFLGYSVIRPTRISGIGRTILKPEACNGISGYMCLQKYTVNLLGTVLEVRGFPFISQDTDVTVCAHAACWMCFRYFTERYTAYAEIYPYQITQLTTYLLGGRLLPSKGLYMEQVVEMFSRFGFYPRIYSRKEWNRQDPNKFDRLLYYYIESGIPLVAGIKPDHAVAAIGHTADFGLTSSEHVTFSNHFLTGLIVNDDNTMPYQILPRVDCDHLFQSHRTHRSKYLTDEIDSFVVPLYEKVYLAAEDVEVHTMKILEDSRVGLKANSRSLSLEDCVIRIYLTTSRSYKEQRRRFTLPYDLSLIYTQLPMPKFIWVAELSNKAHFRDGNILGEIIFDATASDEDLVSWLAIHYPETLMLNDRMSHKAGIAQLNFPKAVAYSVYEHNLHKVQT